jgi:hypothetical protein
LNPTLDLPEKDFKITVMYALDIALTNLTKLGVSPKTILTNM